MVTSVQDRYAPQNACFGCGPANTKGLGIKSHPATEAQITEQAASGHGTTGLLVAEWKPSPHHEAFPGMLNGGIVGTLLDCHSNWTAAVHLMEKAGVEDPPCTVTADYHIALRRPTPTDCPLLLRAWIDSSTDDRATVEAELVAGGKVCATCRGTFVAVREGHPAYHRW